MDNKLIIFLAFLSISFAQEELLKNPDFEQPFSGDDWYAFCGDMTQVTDAYTGSFAAQITDRTEDWCNVNQDVTLTPNTRYSFSAVIKSMALLEGALWHPGQLLVAIDYPDGSTDYLGISSLPYLRPDHGWQKMKGDFKLDDRTISKARVYVQISEPGVDYIVDTASLTVIPDDPGWRQDANIRIEEIRMNDITINLHISEGYDPASISLEVFQKTHSFPFGSAIVGAQIAADDDYALKYQNCFYSNFNWAVQERELKWNNMEEERGQIEFPDETIRRLNERSVPIRGHCIFWGKEKHVPQWMINTTTDYVLSEVARRIEYLVPRYSGQLIHWDVNNEQEHGPWYEENTLDPNVLTQMFQDIRSYDSFGELFLNEYGLLTYSQSTQAVVNTADRLASHGCDVGGIGAQSHWNGAPDLDAVAARIDVLESGGYPVWITELDVDESNVTLRAEIFDDLVTLYFSRSAIHGILLWGFSDNHGPCKETCSLFEGDDFVPNEAGERWIEMIKSRWHTIAEFSCSSPDETFGVRGFYGDYDLKVFNDGTSVKNETFTLPVGSAFTVFIEI